MANYNSKKRKKAGAQIKPIGQMVDTEKTSADSYFEKLEETKIKGDVDKMGKVIDVAKEVFVNDVELETEVEKELKEVVLEKEYAPEFNESAITNDNEILTNEEKAEREEFLNEVYEQMDEELTEILRQKEILDSHIRYAIYSSKELGRRGILSKQFKSIVNGYEHTLGVKMSDEQQLYIKKLTEEQAKAVLNVINKYNRYKSNKAIQERIARKLATNE